MQRPFFSASRLILAILLGGALFVFPFLQTRAAVGINRQINYQGKLLTSAGVPVTDGTYSIKFSIYNTSTTGTRLWTAAGTTLVPTAISVTVQSGLFSVALGDVSAGQNALNLDWNQDALFLGVTVSSDSEMTPRKRLTAVPYAFNAESLQGQSASSSVTSTGGTLFALRQQSADAATADRTALFIATSGTSNVFDYLIKASNGTDVFTVSRQGHVTTTGSLAFNAASGSSLMLGGQSVCLANGTNCILTDFNWSYNAASDFIRQATPTTDVVLGDGASSTAPLFISLTGTSASSNRLIVGQNQNMDVVVGNTTSTITNTLFQLSGNDLFVQGNIGSATSVYTNGSFIAGSGSTYFSDGSIVKNNGALAMRSTGGDLTLQTLTSGDLIFDPVSGGSGTSTFGGSTSDFINFVARISSHFLPATDNAVTLGSSALRWSGLDAVTVTSTNATFTNTTSTNLFVTTGSLTNLSLTNGTSTSWFGFTTASGTTLNANAFTAAAVTIASGAINNTTIGLSTPAAAVFTNVTSTNATTTNFAVSGSVNSHLKPSTDNTYTLGTPSLRWKGLDVINVTSTNSTSTYSTVEKTLNNILVRDTVLASQATFTSAFNNTQAVFVHGQYAYLVHRTSNKLEIVDVSNPAFPKSIGSVSTNSDGPIAVHVQGRYAYVATGISGFFEVFDVSNPTSPVFVSSRALGGPATGQFISGRYAYLTATTTKTLEIIDIANPNNPLTISSVTTPLSAQPKAIFVQGRYAFILAETNIMDVIDVTDPSNPVNVGTAGINGNDLFVSGRYAYVSDEKNNRLGILDVSNPTAVSTVLNFDLVSAPGGIFVNGRYAYVTLAPDRLSVIDVASSTSPQTVANITLTSTLDDVFVSGRYAYANTTASPATLSIVNVFGIETTALQAHSAEVGNLQVLTNAHIMQLLNVSGGLAVGSAGIQSQGALSVFTSSSQVTSTFIFNSASHTAPVLEVRGNCDNGTSSTASMLMVAGNVTDNRKFRVGCNGTVAIDGTFNTGGADFAEYFFAGPSSSLVTGDIVSLVPGSTSTIERASVLRREAVVGVVSSFPGFVGNSSESIQNNSQYVTVGLLGQIPTKADASNQAISIGDMLTVGADGYAIKAQGPGMVIGKAMEGLASATGTIRVLVQPTWWAGDSIQNSVFTLHGSIATSSAFTLSNTVFAASSSLFSIKNGAGAAMLTISELGNVSVTGDLAVGRRLYLGSKTSGVASTSTYIYVDDTLGPTSTYIATNADGWQTSSTYDYAERFFSTEQLRPGDLVVTDPSGVNMVKRSTFVDETVLGIVSTRPGFVTGAYVSGTHPIALAGRVPTRVSTQNGPIEPGDQLAPSTQPGVAVKAVASGPVVGVALEGYGGGGEGMISVFVQPGWKGGEIAVQGPAPSAVVYTPPKIEAGVSPRKGLAKITAGSKEVTVSFASLNAYPLITATPYGLLSSGWGIANVTDHGFTIVLKAPEQFDAVFAWSAEPSQAGDVMSFSDGTSAPYDAQSGLPVMNAATSSDSEPTPQNLESEPESPIQPEPEAQPEPPAPAPAATSTSETSSSAPIVVDMNSGEVAATSTE